MRHSETVLFYAFLRLFALFRVFRLGRGATPSFDPCLSPGIFPFLVDASK